MWGGEVLIIGREHLFTAKDGGTELNSFMKGKLEKTKKAVKKPIANFKWGHPSVSKTRTYINAGRKVGKARKRNRVGWGVSGGCGIWT